MDNCFFLFNALSDCTEEILGEQICCAEVKNTAGAVVVCGKPDVLSEIKIEDMDYSEGFGTSSCSMKNSEHLSFELLQELMEGDEHVPQSFVNQPNQLADVSDHSSERTCSVKENSFDDITAEKAAEVVSPLDEVSNHQKTSDLSNSDVDKSSIGNGFLACSFSQSCHDCIDNDGSWNTGAAHGNEPESVKILEELSPIDESSTDMVSPPKIVQSDLCGSTEMNCTSLEEVVQMQGEFQLDSVVCCGVRPKHMLLDMEIGHSASDCTFSFDKTLDLAQPVNFIAQDGRLESIVYDALNNHVQRMASENRSSVGLPDTAVIQSAVVDYNGNCSEDKMASDNKISLPVNVEWPLKDKLNSVDCDTPRSVNNEGPEELVLQHQLFQSCTNMLNHTGVMPGISNAEESQKLSAGDPNSSATSLQTDGQIKKSELLFDEESNEEHAPKKLLSKRKV